MEEVKQALADSQRSPTLECMQQVEEKYGTVIKALEDKVNGLMQQLASGEGHVIHEKELEDKNELLQSTLSKEIEALK